MAYLHFGARFHVSVLNRRTLSFVKQIYGKDAAAQRSRPDEADHLGDFHRARGSCGGRPDLVVAPGASFCSRYRDIARESASTALCASCRAVCRRRAGEIASSG